MYCLYDDIPENMVGITWTQALYIVIFVTFVSGIFLEIIHDWLFGGMKYCVGNFFVDFGKMVVKLLFWFFAGFLLMALVFTKVCIMV